MNRVITIRFSEEEIRLYEELKREANGSKRSISGYMKWLLDREFKERGKNNE